MAHCPGVDVCRMKFCWCGRLCSVRWNQHIHRKCHTMMVLTHNRSGWADILLVRLYDQQAGIMDLALLTKFSEHGERICNTFDRSRASLRGKTEHVNTANQVSHIGPSAHPVHYRRQASQQCMCLSSPQPEGQQPFSYPAAHRWNLLRCRELSEKSTAKRKTATLFAVTADTSRYAYKVLA